jgi:uncharacterized damage-inducible protein DinB
MRPVRVVLAALIVPAALAAQQPAANPITQSYRAFGTRYGGWLTAAFDSIPADKYGFKPTAVQQTVGYVAQHLEDANYQLCARFGGLERTMTARDSLADTIKAGWPKDTLVARLKASLAFCDSALARVDDAQLADELPAGPPGSGRTAVRARYLLAFVTDLVDHYSQIANYMRLNAMVPPSAQPRPSR